MVNLLPLLREQAERRGLVAVDSELTPGAVFALVRDMPYQRANSRESEATIQEWRGTCSGKHYLLKALLEELGFEARLVMCTHLFTAQNTGHFPVSLRAQVCPQPIPDVHTFVRLKTEAGWMDVDATWPCQAKSLGMTVNDQFCLGVNMRIACDPIEIFEVPQGGDPQAIKEKLIETYCGPQMEQRDQFIEGISQWLQEST
jgi:hypothetical protein